eukprot:scaffold87560_cov69-Attheya_sp.AAC.4
MSNGGDSVDRMDDEASCVSCVTILDCGIMKAILQQHSIELWPADDNNTYVGFVMQHIGDKTISHEGEKKVNQRFETN